MADFRFNGRELHSKNGALIGKVDGASIRDDRGSSVGKIDGTKIFDARGSLIAKVDGDKIFDSRGSKIAAMMDIRKSIDGPGGTTLAALWVHFVR